ncbi:MAG: hypothetical protein HC869_15350 [Rhodospirillales bacterium]|nr:hypothetical protein [Rhodospirillales bacterium]
MDSDLLDIERVEILKGPQGTLFGRNAAARDQRHHAAPGQPSPSALFQVGYGNYSTAALRASVSSALNDSGSVRGRLSYSGRSGDGYVDAVGFDRDAFDADRHSARGQLEFDVGEHTLLRLSGDYMSIREGMWGMESSGQAIAQKHPTSTAHQVAGSMYRARGWRERAIKEFDAAIALDPTDSWSYVYAAHTWLAAGDVAKAEAQIRIAMRLDPHFPSRVWFLSGAGTVRAESNGRSGEHVGQGGTAQSRRPLAVPLSGRQPRSSGARERGRRSDRRLQSCSRERRRRARSDEGTEGRARLDELRASAEITSPQWVAPTANAG